MTKFVELRRLGGVALVALGVGFLAPGRTVEANMKPGVCAQKLCAGHCVAPTPQNGCGAASCSACGVVGAAAVCEGAGCGYQSCWSGYQDLDGKRSNGCEAIVTNRLWFQLPGKYKIAAAAGVASYQFIGVASGRMSQVDNVDKAMPAGFSVRVLGREAAEAIDRCLTISAALPASSKAWIELYTTGPGAIVQVPYTDNSPPGYAELNLRVPASPEVVVTCHVNSEPAG